MTDGEVTPKQAVVALMKGTVPERADAIDSLWSKYDPDVVLIDDRKHITLNADKDRITFDAKGNKIFRKDLASDAFGPSGNIACVSLTPASVGRLASLPRCWIA